MISDLLLNINVVVDIERYFKWQKNKKNTRRRGRLDVEEGNNKIIPHKTLNFKT